MRIVSSVVVLAALAGCNGARLDGLDKDQAGLDARVASLEAENAELIEAVESLSTQLDALEASTASGLTDAEDARTALDDRLATAEEGLAASVAAIDATEDRLDTAEGRLDTAEERLGGLEADLATQEEALLDFAGDLGTVEADLTTLADRVTVNEGAITDLQVADTDVGARVSDLEDEALDVIDGVTTLAVPGTYATVRDALDALDRTRIVAGGEAQIVVADGTYTVSDWIVSDHPDAHRIVLRSASNDPTKTTLSFSRTGGAFVNPGQVLRVRGLTLDSDGTGAATDHGLFVSSNAVAILQDVVIQDFPGNCVLAVSGGVVTSSRDGLALDGCGGAGVVLANNATAVTPGLISESHTLDGAYVVKGAVADLEDAELLDNGGDGIDSREGAVVIAERAIVDGSGVDGVFATSRAFVDVRDGEITNSSGDGLDATIYGLINAYSATVSGSGAYGALATNYGVVDVRTATISGNTLATGSSGGGTVHE